MLRVLLGCLLLLASCRFDGSGISLSDRAGDAAAGDGSPLDRQPSNDSAVTDRGSPDLSFDLNQPFAAPEPVAELNTGKNEDDPTLRGDMLEIFFERDGDIWTARRASVNQPWEEPQLSAALSSEDGETNPELLPDGLTIFFASDREESFDIYQSRRSTLDSPWSAPVPVSELNTSSSDHPAASPDQLTMIVISDRSGSLGQHDFFLSTRKSTGDPWGSVTAAGLQNLNTSKQESSAWLTSSTLVLYYASSRGTSHDIWLSTRAAPGKPFAAPVNVSSVNSSKSDEDPWLSPDLRTIYFSSNRNGDQNDLFVARR